MPWLGWGQRGPTLPPPTLHCMLPLCLTCQVDFHLFREPGGIDEHACRQRLAHCMRGSGARGAVWRCPQLAGVASSTCLAPPTTPMCRCTGKSASRGTTAGPVPCLQRQHGFSHACPPPPLHAATHSPFMPAPAEQPCTHPCQAPPGDQTSWPSPTQTPA
jgi:hypothetical protein